MHMRTYTVELISAHILAAIHTHRYGISHTLSRARPATLNSETAHTRARPAIAATTRIRNLSKSAEYGLFTIMAVTAHMHTAGRRRRKSCLLDAHMASHFLESFCANSRYLHKIINTGERTMRGTIIEDFLRGYWAYARYILKLIDTSRIDIYARIRRGLCLLLSWLFG